MTDSNGVMEIFEDWGRYLTTDPEPRMALSCQRLWESGEYSSPGDAVEDAARIEFLAALSGSGIRQDRHARFVLYDDAISEAFARELATVTGTDRDEYRTSRGANRRAKRDLYMVLRTRGGDPDAAYVAMRYLQRAFREVDVAVMEHAWSAGTLFLLGADRVHLGPVAVLGPLDFQIGLREVLGEDASLHESPNRPGSVEELMVAFDEIERRRKADETPSGPEWWSRFLLGSGLTADVVGYCLRLRGHSQALAVRLLQSAGGALATPPEEIAHRLARGYHGHGFALDPVEAEGLLGTRKVRVNSRMARMADTLAESFWVARTVHAHPIRLLTYDHEPSRPLGDDVDAGSLREAFERIRVNPFNRFRWEATLHDGVAGPIGRGADADDDDGDDEDSDDDDSAE
jgi:hypothetical protein